MPEHDAALVVMDVLHVLAECNRQKVCYADVKPANVLLKRRYPDIQLRRMSNCQVCFLSTICCWPVDEQMVLVQKQPFERALLS